MGVREISDDICTEQFSQHSYLNPTRAQLFIRIVHETAWKQIMSSGKHVQSYIHDRWICTT